MVTSRSLSKRSTTILIAAALALGTGLLLFNYLNSVSHVARTIAMRNVVIAAHAIPAHTIIQPAMVTVAQRPADSVEPDATGDVNAVVGQLSVIDIPVDATVSISKVVRQALGGLSVHVPPGMRAVSIALDRVKGVSDLIVAGDHVDVIAVTQPRTGELPHAATILRNKTVLAMGFAVVQPGANAQATPGPDGSTANIETATLAVSPAEAKLLALADLNATLRLALRPQKEGNRIETPDSFVLAPQLSEAPAARTYAPVRRPEAPAARPTAAPRQAAITYIDGDQAASR